MLFRSIPVMFSLLSSVWLSDETVNGIGLLLRHAAQRRLRSTTNELVITSSHFWTKLTQAGECKVYDADTWNSICNWHGFSTHTRGGKEHRFTKDLSKLQIGIPIHVPGHWLLAWIDFVNKRISIFDSMGYSRQSFLAIL